MRITAADAHTYPPSRRLLCQLAACLLLAAGACSSPAGQLGSRSSAAQESSTRSPGSTSPEATSYDAGIDPAEFVERIDNPYFSLEPGTVFRLRGATEEGIERETITVTDRTKEILGVTTTVVRDVARVRGEVKELTYDWYAQDRDGNVWYFGENTAEYEDGRIVSRSGSWRAGVDGAEAGVIMNADPRVTDSFRQEYYEGEAEDMYWVVATGDTKSVPLGEFDRVIRTLEWTPLEPRIVVEKFYAPGLGLLAERALSGGKEIVELLDIDRP